MRRTTFDGPAGSRRDGAPAPPHAEDLTLAGRLLAGEEAAARELARRFAPALLRYARARLRADGELARDVVQATLLHALARLDSYRGEASLLGWLLACCRNEVRMLARRRSARPLEVELDAAAAESAGARSPAPDAEATLLARERAERVHLALDGLPPRWAAALEWKYLEGLSVEEIGSRLEIGAKAAESLLSRARSAFRDSYGELTRDVDEESWR